MEIVEECNEEAIEKKKMMKSIPDSVDISSLSLSEAVDSMNKTMETRELDYFFKDRTEKKFFKKSYSKKTAYYVRRMRRIRHLSIERPLSFAGPWVFTDPPATSISYIPRSVLRLKEKPVLRDESLREILSRLPVKSLMRFKCVCKRWQSLIQDHSFVDLHLTQSQRRPDLLIAVPGEGVVRFFSAEYMFEGGAAIQRIEIPSWGHGALSSINGLICFVDLLEPAACIYNLSTREKTRWIKTSVKREEIRLGFDYRPGGPVFGFGFDPATKEHKVICMWEICRYTTMPSYELIGGTTEKICEVLTVGQNSWRRIDDVPQYMLRGRAIYANGSIYRRNADERLEYEVIVAFDVGSEKFRSIPIPNFIVDTWDSDGVCDLRTDYLLEVDGRIALVDEISVNAVRLWICHENKEKMTSRWTENTVTLPGLKGQRLCLNAIPGTNQIVILGDPTPRGCLLLFYYDLKRKTSRKVEITGISPLMKFPFVYQPYTFVESLLPVHKQQLHHAQLPSDDLLTNQVEVGHYNSFLNVITQCFWHLKGFRNEFMSSSHVHVGNPCAVCALYDAFTALSKASTNTEVDAASAPSCWRITPTDFYPYINYFREAEMNDTYEVLAIIFDCLHRSFTPCSGWDCVDCACIAHTVFAMKIFEEVKCWRCSVESKQQYTSFFHQTLASDLRTIKINNNDCSFDELIKLVEMNRQLACDPMADGCRELNHVHRSLKTPPHVFTTVLGWQSTCESADAVSATLKALTTEIDIGVLYHGLDPGNKHYLVSMACCYGKHYYCFAYSCEHEKRWIMFDDESAKVIGCWNDVLSMCQQEHLQPQVLFFEAN